MGAPQQMLFGGGGRPQLNYVFSANTANAALNVSSISGYVSGISDITITVNSGVWLYATVTSNAGLTLIGGSSGDTIKLINNGYIAGQGGTGGGLNGATPVSGTNGGPALALGFNTTIDNTNAAAYIGGGGGGGDGGTTNAQGTGGGGAGGGAGGTNVFYSIVGGAGGTIGASGSNGSGGTVSSGGGGGRIFPGLAGASVLQTTTNVWVAGLGGGAGGSGSTGGFTSKHGPGASTGCGGGGGWGASGGSSISGVGAFSGTLKSGAGGAANASGGNGSYSGGGGTVTSLYGLGGNAVQLNGHSVVWVSGNTTRVYGAVA